MQANTDELTYSTLLDEPFESVFLSSQPGEIFDFFEADPIHHKVDSYCETRTGIAIYLC